MMTLFLLWLLPLTSHAEFYTEHVKPTLERASDQTSLALWLTGTASVLGARSYDNETRDHWVDHQKMSLEDSRIGERYISYGVNIGIAGLQLWLDRDNGISHIRALAFTGLTTVTMKKAFGRERPNQADHQSFPSGHTSSAFASATSLAYAYGWKAGVPAYAMAFYTGLSRIADDDHWLSDVTGGAFLGFIWGRAGFFSSASGDSRQSIIWMPVIESSYAGIQIVSHF
jgi:hypothetical protein